MALNFGYAFVQIDCASLRRGRLFYAELYFSEPDHKHESPLSLRDIGDGGCGMCQWQCRDRPDCQPGPWTDFTTALRSGCGAGHTGHSHRSARRRDRSGARRCIGGRQCAAHHRPDDFCRRRTDRRIRLRAWPFFKFVRPAPDRDAHLTLLQCARLPRCAGICASTADHRRRGYDNGDRGSLWHHRVG